jgi:hypothetical protein
MFEIKIEDTRVAAPMLFTAQADAEEELRVLRKGMPDAYLQAVGEHVESDVNEALDNAPELRVFEIDPWLLGERLEDSHLMYVVADRQVRRVEDLAEKLREA